MATDDLLFPPPNGPVLAVDPLMSPWHFGARALADA